MIWTRRSASGNGSGRSKTVLMAEKTAVLAPVPSARVKTTVRVKPGVRSSARMLYRMFRKKASTPWTNFTWRPSRHSSLLFSTAPIVRIAAYRASSGVRPARSPSWISRSRWYWSSSLSSSSTRFGRISVRLTKRRPASQRCICTSFPLASGRVF